MTWGQQRPWGDVYQPKGTAVFAPSVHSTSRGKRKGLRLRGFNQLAVRGVHQRQLRLSARKDIAGTLLSRAGGTR
jgi:hypothetical protein